MPVPRSARPPAAALLALALVTSGPALADSPPPWLHVILNRPDVQAGRLIALFKGSRAPHPAAALAAWTQATGGLNVSKPLAAGIAALNPAMAAELRVLHRATLTFRADDAGRSGWALAAPADDGTLAAAVTALALTDGAPVDPVAGVPAYRLGPPGAPVAAARPGLTALADTPEGLAAALAGPATPAPNGPSGWAFRFDPAGLRPLTGLNARRVAAACAGLGCAAADGRVSLEGETLSLETTARIDPAAPAEPAAVDRAWLAALPASGVVGLAAVALGDDPRPAFDRFLRVADAVQKADPVYKDVAPLRARLNLIAAASRVRPEAELWPKLRGLAAAALGGSEGEVRGAVVVLAATTPEAAETLASQVLPRLAATYLDRKPEPGGSNRRIGTVSGRPVEVAARGSLVVVGWGDGVLDNSLGRLTRPEGSPVSLLGDGPRPRRLAAFWPGRLRQVAAPGSPLAKALDGAPPVVWRGWDAAGAARDTLTWTGLRGVVRRGLEALPLRPPPDRAGGPTPAPTVPSREPARP